VQDLQDISILIPINYRDFVGQICPSIAANLPELPGSEFKDS